MPRNVARFIGPNRRMSFQRDLRQKAATGEGYGSPAIIRDREPPSGARGVISRLASARIIISAETRAARAGSLTRPDRGSASLL